jgi:hypothetical protein
MNVEIGTEAAQLPEKEYKYGIFVAVQECLFQGGGGPHTLAGEGTGGANSEEGTDNLLL